MAKTDTKLSGKEWRLELIQKEPSAAKELLGLFLDAESAPVTDSDTALEWIAENGIPRLYECLMAMAAILDRIPEVDKKMKPEERAKGRNGDTCAVWVSLCIWANLPEGQTMGYYASQLRLLHLKLLEERARREETARSASTSVAQV